MLTAIAVAWFALSVPAGILLGRAIKHADDHQQAQS